VAQPGNRSQQLRLRREGLRRLVRKSWRASAFNKLVARVGDELGFDEEEFNVDQIDRDLSSNSSSVMETLERNVSDQAALEAVGLAEFNTLSHQVIEEVVPHISLPIRSLHNDVLTEVFGDQATSSGDIQAFLHEIFSSEDVKKTPTPSVQVLNEVSRGKGPIQRENTMSVGLVPAEFDLQEAGEYFLKDTLDPSAADAVDLTVRADIVGPLDKEMFSVFSDGYLSAEENLRRGLEQASDLDEGEL
jgi:hypothetical protein